MGQLRHPRISSAEPLPGSAAQAFDLHSGNREVIFKFRRQVHRARLWEVDFPSPSFVTEGDHLSEWCQAWAQPGDPSAKIVSVPRARLLCAVSKHVFETKYETKEKELRQAYVSGFRRRLDAERRATMSTEVYAKGEEKIHCDKIETVVVRDRGRP